ncbi:MAG TPA: hypothetical protein VF168_02775 [Trueperaceae bacterium]
MYEFLRGLHNLIRWLVLLGGFAAVVVMLRGLLARTQWTGRERGIGAAFAGTLHLQVVVGILLYLVSPIVRGGFADFGAAMGDPDTRFFLVEHGLIMILAAVSAQVGLSMARRAETDRARYVRATIGVALALLLVLYAIPWGRSLIPWA